MSRKLTITTGVTARGGAVTRKEVSWEGLAARLQRFSVLNITLDQYSALSTDQKADVKDSAGFFIGGHFSDDTRKKAALVGRSLLTLDVDALPAFELPGVKDVYHNFAHVYHTSASHRRDKPKFRLVFPLSRDIATEEYEPLARRVAALLSIDAVDRVSYRPSQLMYMPVHCSDGKRGYYNHTAAWLDPDALLATYADWRDFAEWPRGTEETDVRNVADAMEDPCTKKGVIGAFCRIYDIHQAITHFGLPYLPTEHDNRYTPVGATGSQGAVVYSSATCEAAFLYSHHSHDPAASRCLNSWDLVRLCKWPNRPNEASQKEMQALAYSDDAVRDEAEGRPLLDFEDLTKKSSEDSQPADSDEKVKAKTANYKNLADAIYDLVAAPIIDVDVRRAACKHLISKLAAARLDPSDEDVLAAALRKTYPKGEAPSKDRIHSDIKKLRSSFGGTTEADDGTITDIEMDLVGEVLARHYGTGKHLRRVGKAFWVYDGGCWRMTEDEQVKGRMLDTIVSLRVQRPDDKPGIVSAVGEGATTALVQRLWTAFPSIVARQHSDKDPLGLRSERPAIINCLNGELHLNADGIFVLEPHNPDNFLTAQIPINYDPDALCPEWDTFCNYIFEDALDPSAMRGHLEELGGYVIQPTRWLRTWVLFQGTTAAGKTTIGRVFGNLLGRSAVMRPLSSYDGRNSHAEAGLVGKLMLLDEDFDKGAVLPDGFIKKISEAKELTANPKSKDEFSFVCRALPIIISNSWPATRDASDALIDRALVWHFDKQFMGTQRNDAKADRMVLGELPGILNQFIAGFERLRARGHWSPPLECLFARDEWVSKSNSVGRFLSDCVERVTDKKLKIVATDVWNAYCVWMSEAMPGARKVGRNEFYDRCEHNLGVRVKIKGDHFFVDVRLKKEAVVDF